ncbi:hypothetical protein [Bordetella bronchiseptica]|uniref:hypothetical protein n=1 Tax=Bordetella bronchiseptica TaxID=518 RepID=UPI00053B61E5|nr:hypothetical protein [Bordetella bronchiseptica]
MSNPILHTLESRPSDTTSAGKCTERLDIPVTGELYDAIAALATMAGKTKAEYARAVLEQHAFGAIGFVRARANTIG